ncbi:GATA transcription factor 15, putative [Theobroma cacao]|uniref:GATA transcription factor 15, putative n=1 Tax=Theobroma cacao TaxID=3641 RepID=A0A061F4J3_THECC|nr:GATA transcription factor 15, putative [Theobroma cacao]
MGVMDLREKKSLSEVVMMSENNKKFCTDCKTTKTPLWRGGPAGPKSLCNACGIRYRKKRRAMLGLNKGPEKKKERSQSSHSSSTTTTTSSASVATTNVGDKKPSGQLNGLSESVKMRLYALGSEVFLQRSSSSSLLSGVVKKQRCQRRRKLGEEEQAAFSLMALSCGSVFFSPLFLSEMQMPFDLDYCSLEN